MYVRWLRIAARVAASEEAREPPYVQSLGTVGEFAAWAVDGEFIRNNIDIDFVAGGNHSRYPSYVPEGEIWLEATNDPHDMAATAIHETIEATIMRDLGLDYETAHDYADKYEVALRNAMQSGDVQIGDNVEAIALANERMQAELAEIVESAPSASNE